MRSRATISNPAAASSFPNLSSAPSGSLPSAFIRNSSRMPTLLMTSARSSESPTSSRKRLTASSDFLAITSLVGASLRFFLRRRLSHSPKYGWGRALTSDLFRTGLVLAVFIPLGRLVAPTVRECSFPFACSKNWSNAVKSSASTIVI